MPAVPGQVRTVFTEEQKSSLVEQYNNGLKTTKMENHSKITELALKMNLSFDNVKNFIDNHNRKVVNPSAVRRKVLKRRVPSTFNIYVAEQKKTMKGLNPVDQFRSWAEEWKSLPSEVKASYSEKRGALSIAPSNQKERDARVSYLHRQLEAIVFEFESLGVQSFSVCIDLVRKEQLIAGSGKGKTYLKENRNAIDKFNAVCQSVPVHVPSAAITHEDEGVVSRSDLIKEVRNALNGAYAKSMQLPTSARFPYGLHASKGLVVDGLPTGLYIKDNVSMMSYSDLKKLLDVIPLLKFYKNQDPLAQPSVQETGGRVVAVVEVDSQTPPSSVIPPGAITIGQPAVQQTINVPVAVNLATLASGGAPSDLDLMHRGDEEMEDAEELCPSEMLEMLERGDDGTSSVVAEVPGPCSTTRTKKKKLERNSSAKKRSPPAKRTKASCKKSKPQEEPTYPFEEILRVQYQKGKKGYLVKWAGASPSWTASGNIPLELRKEFHTQKKSN